MAHTLRLLACVIGFIAFIVPALGHVCLLQPPQRGGYDISTPGNFACFQNTGPCGSKPAQTPNITLWGSAGFTMLFQQNLNHYNPGHPGFLDVAWAVGPNPKPSQFQTLSAIPDYWPHLQAQQTNFSVHITVPNTNCDHCVLRVRYNPNKPTEPIFHQCTDVKIIKTPSPPSFGRLFGLAQYGSYEDSWIVEVNYEGELIRLSELPFNVRGVQDVDFSGLANGVATIDVSRQRLYFMGFGKRDSVLTDAKASVLVTYDVASKSFTGSHVITPDSSSQWTALVANQGDATNPLFVLELLDTGNQEWKFQLRSYNPDTGVLSPASQGGNFPVDQTYVNYFWSEYDHVRGKLYVLSGDENSLHKLDVRLYTVDVKNGNNVTYTLVDNSAFTVSSVHVDPDTGLLLAMSPGLFPGPNAKFTWSTVVIDPKTGNVKPLGVAAPPGKYSYYYGGGVYGTSIAAPYIMNQFKSELTGATELGFVHKATGELHMTTALNLGTNNYIQLNTLTYLPRK